MTESTSGATPGPVRVGLVRSGGFAGMTLHAQVDTDRLPTDEAQQVAAAVQDLDLGALAEQARRPARGADRYQYDLTVDRGAGPETVSLPEAAVPAELKPLIALLMRHAGRG